MLSLAVALVLVAAVVVIGRRVEAPVRVGLLSIGVLAGMWWAALALEHSGWRDTDGWVDCNNYCNRWHYLGSVLFWTPPLAGALLGLVLIGVLIARVARGRSVQKGGTKSCERQ